MSSQDPKGQIVKPDVSPASDSVAGSGKSAKPLFTMDLLAKHEGSSGKDDPALPLMSIVNGDGKAGNSGVVGWTPAAVKAPDLMHAQPQIFKPFKLPGGQVENTGYVPETPAQIKELNSQPGPTRAWQTDEPGLAQANAKAAKADVTKWTPAVAAGANLGDYSGNDALLKPAAGKNSDAVAPSVRRVSDSALPPSADQIIINSGAGSRAQLFNYGERVERSVTIPSAIPPSDAPAQATSCSFAPSADVPQPQPYSGAGSRARLFREQPRN